jgi:plasmid stabilization system protein ParE
MPRLIYAPSAVGDLQRLREFLRLKNPAAAKRAGVTILQALQVLRLQAQLGRPAQDMSDEYREWVIDFGNSGYVVRYRLDGDNVIILAIRHQKEAGF